LSIDKFTIIPGYQNNVPDRLATFQQLSGLGCCQDRQLLRHNRLDFAFRRIGLTINS
jgi:hypothetical protein